MSCYRLYQSVRYIKADGATHAQVGMQLEVRTRMLIEAYSPEYAQLMRDEIRELTDFIYTQWVKENT
jgi:hypothetical protein